MRQYARVVGAIAAAVAIAAIFVFLVIPGCIDQNQDNSPISINNSQGRLVLSVTCNTEGSVAYVTDGRNVYRYDRNTAGGVESWECILSQGERLEMAAKHDPREQPPADDAREKAGEKKPGAGESPKKDEAVTNRL